MRTELSFCKKARATSRETAMLMRASSADLKRIRVPQVGLRVLGVIENMRGTHLGRQPRADGCSLIAATGLEVPVEKMRFKTTAGTDVTDSVRQALLRIVRARISRAVACRKGRDVLALSHRCRIWMRCLRRPRCAFAAIRHPIALTRGLSGVLLRLLWRSRHGGFLARAVSRLHPYGPGAHARCRSRQAIAAGVPRSTSACTDRQHRDFAVRDAASALI